MSVTLAVGLAAAKLIFRVWARGSILEGSDTDLAALVGRAISDTRSSRRVARQFDGLADEIDERIQPFLSIESNGVNEGERASAIEAVAESLVQVRLSIADLLDVDLDPSKLEARVRLADPNAAQRHGLGEGGTAVYDAVLAECCATIISITSRLPGFDAMATAELLRRDSYLIDLANQVLEGLPAAIVPLSWGRGSEDERFESRYRHAIYEYSNELRLYGVTSPTAKSVYPLSVAYISLSVDSNTLSAPPSRAANLAKGGDPSRHLVTTDPTLRIEEFLQQTDRVVLTGGAGSGKTTLLQWLAISATSAQALGEVGGWSNRVPFMISLRRYAGKALPQPEQFLEMATPSIAGAMPVAWVHRVLEDGRAMLLIDGLDEVALEQRDDVRAWVLDLVRNYPDSKVIVTSRTTAMTKDWEELSEFSAASLLSMDNGDIQAFIRHWHRAARSQSSSEAQRELLVDHEKSLLRIIRDRRVIRNLCDSPLLAALICALHVESGSNLPDNRMELYRTALDMLIARRDRDRRIDAEDVRLGLSESESVLRAFAHWLHENGLADAPLTEYNRIVDSIVTRLYRIDAEPEAVAHQLLERSGVLREPVPGRVDFVHRTFLEYLAAAQLVNDNFIEKLVRQGHDDYWREVVIMAAGHCNGPQREALLSGLLDRGATEPNLRHRLYLLAVACMETSPDIPPPLQERLAACLAEVLPPQNMTEAAAVASAGVLGVQRLSGISARATITRASVRALALIGGDEALAALRTYGQDPRVTVIRELIRAWDSFDVERYAHEVLANSPLDDGLVEVNSVEQLAHLPLLRNLTGVYASLAGRISSPDELPDNPAIYGIDLSQSPWLRDFSELPTLTGLVSISARWCRALESAEGLERFPRLRYVDLSDSVGLTNAEVIGSFSELQHLHLGGTSLKRLPLRAEQAIDSLYLGNATDLESLGDALPVSDAYFGHLPRLVNVRALRESTRLRRLTMYSTAPRVETWKLPSGLRHLAAWEGGGNTFSGGQGLTSVNLYGAPLTSVNFDWLFGLEHLETLDISVEPASEVARRITDLGGLRNLRRVTVGNRNEIREAPSIEGMRLKPDASRYRLVYERE